MAKVAVVLPASGLALGSLGSPRRSLAGISQDETRSETLSCGYN
jgi:hypothetical protein